jgi:hypothetical protein
MTDKLTVEQLLDIVRGTDAGNSPDAETHIIMAGQLAEIMRENERLKEENELFRKGFGLAQTIKDFRNKDSGDATKTSGE